MKLRATLGAKGPDLTTRPVEPMTVRHGRIVPADVELRHHRRTHEERLIRWYEDVVVAEGVK